MDSYRLLVKGVQDYAIFMLNPSGIITTWNLGAERISGYTAHEIIGDHFSKFYPKEDIDAGKPEYELQIASSVGRYEEEGWRIRKNGEKFWANVLITALRNAEGELVGYAEVSRDLTERRKAEETLRQSEERLRAVLEGIQDYAIFMLDTDGYITTWNKGAERIKGYTPDEIIGHHFSKFYVEEAIRRGHPDYELQQASATGRYEEEGWRVRKDGNLIWANVVINALRNEKGDLIGFAKVTRDLTEKKKADEALKESEDRYRMLVEGVKDYAIYMLDREGLITSWNQGAERIKGYRAEEVIGKPLSIFFTKEDKDADKPAQELHVARNLGRYEGEGWRLRKDGSRIWASIVLAALYDSDGTLVGFSKVTRDISERKQVEMQLELTMQNLRKSEEKYRSLAGELENKVSERTAQLETTNQELEAFTYSVSHDLRAPLRAIDGFSRVILSKYKDLLDEDGKDYLERIRESSQQMAELIDGLLGLSRLSKADIRLEKVDLSNIAKDLAAKLKERDLDRNVEFIIANQLVANGDNRLLRTVLQNLFENAWKFTSKKEKAVIEFGKTNYNGEPAYFIKDNGAGFDQAFAGKLFGTFQRLHTADEFPGTGIGLATVQKIIHRHGGRIWAEGVVNSGAAFYFTLES